MSELKRGEMTCREAGRKGGAAAKAAGADYSELGKRGAEALKARYGAAHYQAAGKKGGAVVLERYGVEFFREISAAGVQARAKGTRKRRELIARGRAAEARDE